MRGPLVCAQGPMLSSRTTARRGGKFVSFAPSLLLAAAAPLGPSRTSRLLHPHEPRIHHGPQNEPPTHPTVRPFAEERPEKEVVRAHFSRTAGRGRHRASQAARAACVKGGQ
jgi:hypothetical protein